METSHKENKDRDSEYVLSNEELKFISEIMTEGFKIDEFLNSVISKSHSSKERYALLLKVALKSTTALNALSKQQVEWSRFLAKQVTVWPVMASTSHKLLKEIQQELKFINLGSDLVAPVDVEKFNKRQYEARKWIVQAIGIINNRRECYRPRLRSLEDYSSQLLLNPISLFGDPWAGMLHKPGPAMEAEVEKVEVRRWNEFKKVFDPFCSKLPPLSLATVEEWFPVVKMYFMHISHDRPEHHPMLKELGDYRKDHYQRTQRKRTKIGGKSISKLKPHAPNGATTKLLRSPDSDRRDGIFTKLHKALKAVAKEGDSSSPPK